MKIVIAIIFGLFWMTRAALCAEPVAAIESIGPEDVVQESVRTLQMGTNKFTVFFTYTEAGAKKMLAFSEAHAGQKMRTQVGDYLSAEGLCYAPRDSGEYAKWKEGWLKRRTSKFIGLSASDAEAIVAGLKGGPGK